jgi:hypothetical protein
MSDLIEISYTGDLLAHRRCPRAWAYEKHVGFHPYEQVQAMEGRLVHHAMEWLTAFRKRESRHAERAELQPQLEHYFRVLWARGIRTAFSSKAETVGRVCDNLFPPAGSPPHSMHSTVRAAIEGAQHTEYQLRTVRKLVPLDHFGKQRLLLTGILDVVVQQQEPLPYPRSWKWTDTAKLSGRVTAKQVLAKENDLEIWDYKGSRADTEYLGDYARQLLTYANLYRERTGKRPERCVLFFVNEPSEGRKLLAIPLTDELLDAALEWTVRQVQEIQKTIDSFRKCPTDVAGGDVAGGDGKRGVSEELVQQCTTCGRRFDCDSYRRHLGKPDHADVNPENVLKN